MRCVDPGENFVTWRAAARCLLEEMVPPSEVLWEKDAGLFSSVVHEDAPILKSAKPHLKVPAGFFALAESVACHRDSARWALLYQILWRMTHGGERHLLSITSDPDVAKAGNLAKNVHREIHKMHAFVRFKLIATDATSGRERYAAWFEPENFIVEAGAPFFRKRFANSIPYLHLGKLEVLDGYGLDKVAFSVQRRLCNSSGRASQGPRRKRVTHGSKADCCVCNGPCCAGNDFNPA